MDVLTADTYMVINILFAFLLFTSHALSSITRYNSSDVFVDTMSWQQEGRIKTTTASSKFILTNKAVCAGGSLSWETQVLRTFIDGCFLYGQGNAGSEKSTITYDQSDISLYGVKASLGGGLIVSSAKAEVGLKIPVMFVGQNYTKPSSTSLTEPSPFLLMGSLYSRWPFQQWFVQTEFSKIVGNDLTLFSLGAGYKF